jgi:exopolyphosphatase / guanosine-5'-triphosphate,3'-diphosphate pyrophosphatase
MRLGVLDVGSTTVHLLVVDAYPGAAPRPAFSYKTELRLAQLLDDSGRLVDEGAHRLATFVADAAEVAEDKGVERLVAFATSAVREAPNGDDVLAMVRDKTGIDLSVLSGADEARLTFLAVRRWFGWSSGRLLVFDIGGGSLEVATGIDEEPDGAFSLRLGAGRLTREWFTADPPPKDEVRAMRKHVRAEIARHVPDIERQGRASHVVGTSKTFRQLARLAGAAPSSDGPYVPRHLSHEALGDWVHRLAEMPSAERAELPGVSTGRAEQLLAGAIVADAAMDLFDVPRLEIGPWALREGVILRQLDMMAQ